MIIQWLRDKMQKAACQITTNKIVVQFLIISTFFCVFMFAAGFNNCAKYLEQKGYYTSAEILYQYEILFAKLFSRKDIINKQNMLAEFYIEQGLSENALEIYNNILKNNNLSEHQEVKIRKNKMKAYYYLNQYDKARAEYKNLCNITDKYENLGNAIYALFPDKNRAEKIILNIEIDEGNFKSIKNKIENEDNYRNNQKIRYYRLNKDYKKALDVILSNMQNLPYKNLFTNKYFPEQILENYADCMYELSELYKDNEKLVNANFSETNLSFNNGKNGVSNAYCNGALVIYKTLYNEKHPAVICTQYFCNKLANKNDVLIDKNAQALLMIKRHKNIKELENYCSKRGNY